MFKNKLLDALLNLFDDVRDAREKHIVQLAVETKKAFGLSLIEVGKACMDEGEKLIRIPAGIFMGPFVAPRPYEAPSITKICGAVFNSSDRGWLYCNREPNHERGEHYDSHTGKHWPKDAPSEQQSPVISAVYDE